MHNQPVSTISGIGQKRTAALNSAGILTIRDLLYYFPRKYLNRQNILKISEIKGDEKEVTLLAKLTQLKSVKNPKRTILNGYFSDGSSVLNCAWFNRPEFWQRALVEGEYYIISGKPTWFNGWQISHPVIEHFEDEKEKNSYKKTGRIIPLYPLTAELEEANINSAAINKLIGLVLNDSNFLLVDLLPADILKQLELPAMVEALRLIHFPENEQEKNLAVQRFKFEEFFYLQLIFARRKQKVGDIHKAIKITKAGALVRQLYDILPFELTDAQKRVIKEIHADLTGPKLMNRLVQGDVGSGKTIVSLFAMLMAVAGGYQAVIMAPTEILAEQHYLGFKKMCTDLHLSISILTGKATAKQRKILLPQISDGTAQIIVGTHALIEGVVQFKKLGLVIIDEQHRFGVLQRGELIAKGDNAPNVLVMTATPIPRTMSLSLYGDLDISIIDQLPKGRLPITTKMCQSGNLGIVHKFISQKIQAGEQAYIVFPLIEKSEKSDFHAAENSYAELQSGVFREHSVGLLHGRMKPEEKERVMQDFKANQIQILVSTTVIEVGVDVPNATIMLIMNSERFGLSQLHQLRGRVGRGQKQSYCLLHSAEKTKEESLVRLQVLEKSSDGFVIAEEDFKLRGPGEFFGEKQSGMPDLKIASLLYDQKILYAARKAAFELLNSDPHLTQHKELRNYMNTNYHDKVDFLDM